MAYVKFFTKTVKVSEVNWSDNREIITAFRERILGWWFEPLEKFPVTGHEAFPVLVSVGCAIGSISQFTEDQLEKYGDCAPMRMAVMLGRVDEVFLCERESRHRYYADKLVEGFESLARRGRLTDDTGISGTGKLVIYHEGVSVFDPWVLRDAVRDWFVAYCDMMLSDIEADETKQFCDRVRKAFAGGVK